MPRASQPDLAQIDQLLAGAGLRHGRRKLMAAGFDRQPKHPAQIPAPKRRPRRAPNRIEVIQPQQFTAIPWLLSGFSTRTGGKTNVYNPGELNLGFTPADSRETVLENRRLFFNEVTGNPDFPAVTLRQIHSSLIRRVTACNASPAEARLKGDGLLTNEPGLLLCIQTADCIPVLVADRKNRAVAAFHAGWRGTLKRIVQNGVGRMRLEFGSRPSDLIAAIGPGVGQCCYAVGEEVRSEFLSQFCYAPELFRDVYDSDPVREKYPMLFLTARAPGHSNIGPSLHLDLAEANRRQLLDAGLAPDAISVLGDCTSCHTARYFSHRAEHGFTGRMLSVIGVRPR
ncbi:MAG TPA: peptidoglycan editing factor PgeF [Acidobacteriaceae bacterium]|nr:peptidoglycan editing factor PgeF [Acidobacteriaceae bacterium]